MDVTFIIHAYRSHVLRFQACGDSWFAAHYAGRISLPDMDSCVAAEWAPTAECLLQRRMRDHGFAVARGFATAQSLAQNQIAFRPMIVTGRGAHQNVSGCPLPYPFQRQQTISYIPMIQTLLTVLRKKCGRGILLFPFGYRELRARRDSIALFVPRWERARTTHPNGLQQRAPSVPSAWLRRERNLLAQNCAHGNFQSRPSAGHAQPGLPLHKAGEPWIATEESFYRPGVHIWFRYSVLCGFRPSFAQRRHPDTQLAGSWTWSRKSRKRSVPWRR